MALRSFLVLVLMVGLLARDAAAEEAYDLTGTWRGTHSDVVIEVRLVQDGTSLWIGDEQVTIDAEAGTFALIRFPEQNCPTPQFGNYYTIIDADHLRVDVGGYIKFPNCRLSGGITYELTRVEDPTATPTPPAPPSPSSTPEHCVGDCNRDGRVAVDEAQALVRCAGSVRPAIRHRCRNTCGTDTNRNGLLEISELQLAVRSSLRGCR